MKYLLKTTLFTTAKTVVETQGDRIWEVLTDNLPLDRSWSLDEAIDVLRNEFGWSTSTSSQYARAVLANVMAQEEPAVERIGKKYHWV